MTDSFFSPRDLPPPVWVADSQALAALVQTLAVEPAFAVDTESNSLFAYRERVCLIQFSTPAGDYVLDPFCFTDLSALAPLFADSAQQKIFHAAEYDILCLKRDYGFEFAEIFDTMVAARTLGLLRVGLASILKENFGVQLNKKYQRANWARRPLPQGQLDYARMDTHFLLALRDVLSAQLDATGRTEEARDEFSRLARMRSEVNGFDPHGFWRINSARDLAPAQMAVLRELYLYRERQAERADRPPFKILDDRTLLEIAQHSPRGTQGLKHLHGMTPGQIKRYGAGLLRVIQRGLSAPHPRRPRGQRLSGNVRERYERLHQWRKEKAKARGVESDVILPREALWEIARLAPRDLAELDQCEHLGPWRRQMYGAELIELLKEM